MAYFQQEMSVFQQNKHLAMPVRDTVNTHSWDVRCDQTYENSTGSQDKIQVLRLSKDRDIKNYVSR